MNRCENLACPINTGKGVCNGVGTTDTEAKYANTPERWQEMALQRSDKNADTLRRDQIANTLEKTQRLIDTYCRPEDEALRKALERFKKAVGV